MFSEDWYAVYTLFITTMQSSESLPSTRLDHGLLHLRCLYRKVIQGKPNKMFHVKGIMRTIFTINYSSNCPATGSSAD